VSMLVRCRLNHSSRPCLTKTRVSVLRSHFNCQSAEIFGEQGALVCCHGALRVRGTELVASSTST
jgi:hypothetical protein